jgi:hypothetical protein
MLSETACTVLSCSLEKRRATKQVQSSRMLLGEIQCNVMPPRPLERRRVYLVLVDNKHSTGYFVTSMCSKIKSVIHV